MDFTRIRPPRMALWLVVSIVLAVVVALLAPQQLPVSLYKLSLITTAAWMAYWIDRGLFPYARPDRFIAWCASPGAPGRALSITREQAIAVAASMLRRAILIAAAMIGVALGA
jgi:hypothetical protein